MQYISSPNLPKSPVKLICITGDKPALRAELEALGIEVISVQPYPVLTEPVCAHPDLLLHHLGGNRLLVASGAVDTNRLQQFGFSVTEMQGRLRREYPGDIALNVLRIGDCAFGNRENMDPILLQYLKETNVRFFDVRQGYARCSTCIINEHAIVTADSSIQRAAKSAGLDCLCVPPEEICLPGYPYGFIGGCSGLIAPDQLAFYGNAEQLSYYEAFRDFAAHYGVRLVSLCKEMPPTDVGSFLPLLCE